MIWLHNDKEIRKEDPVYKMISNGNVHSLVIQEVNHAPAEVIQIIARKPNQIC